MPKIGYQTLDEALQGGPVNDQDMQRINDAAGMQIAAKRSVDDPRVRQQALANIANGGFNPQMDRPSEQDAAIARHQAAVANIPAPNIQVPPQQNDTLRSLQMSIMMEHDPLKRAALQSQIDQIQGSRAPKGP